MQLPLNIQWNAAAELDRYLPGENVEAARFVTAFAERRLDAPALFLHGPEGVGKSHLLQGACRRVTANGRVALYLPLSQLLDYGPEVFEGLHGVELLALDELDALVGEAGWQVALFHLFNRLHDRGGGLLFAARCPPAELALSLADLTSRLSWGVVVGLRPVDEATSLAILRQRAAERGLELPEATARYLIQRVPRRLSRLLELFEALDRASLAAGRRLTIPFVRQVLAAQGLQHEQRAAQQ